MFTIGCFGDAAAASLMIVLSLVSVLFRTFFTPLSRRTRHPAVDQQLLQRVCPGLLFVMLSQTWLVCVTRIVFVEVLVNANSLGGWIARSSAEAGVVYLIVWADEDTLS